VAPLTFHCSVVDPPLVIVLGLAVNVFIIGKPAAVIVTISVAFTEKGPLVAVRVYVVSTIGDTNCVPDKGLTPIPWSIETTVAPVTFHCNVDDPPLIIFLGFA
jgi:hypothetical protein